MFLYFLHSINDLIPFFRNCKYFSFPVEKETECLLCTPVLYFLRKEPLPSRRGNKWRKSKFHRLRLISGNGKVEYSLR